MRNEKGQFIKGSSGFTGKHSESAKYKMRIAKLGKPSNRKGYITSEETKLKQRLSHLGKKQTEEWKEKNRQRMLGNTYGFKKGHHINKGMKKSEEYIKKVSGKNAYNWKGGIDAGTRVKNAPRPKPEQCEVRR